MKKQSIETLKNQQIDQNEYGCLLGGTAVTTRTPAGSVLLGEGTPGETLVHYCWDCKYDDCETPWYCQDNTDEEGCQCDSIR
jgi:hypothetical protein